MRIVLILLLTLPQAIPSQDTSSMVAGTITLKDEVKKRKKPIRIDCPHCALLYPGGMPREELILGPANAVQGAFVTVKKGLEGRKFDLPKTPVVLDQRGCRFEPHVVGVQVGQDLVFRNSDPHNHCVHAVTFNNREFNFNLPKGGPDFARTFDAPETMIRIKDNCHVWISAWIGVVDHPFFAVTDPAGKFEIKGLPAGKYTLEIWQEMCVRTTREIEIQGNWPCRADVVLELRKE
jgi:plastocyanin